MPMMRQFPFEIDGDELVIGGEPCTVTFAGICVVDRYGSIVEICRPVAAGSHAIIGMDDDSDLTRAIKVWLRARHGDDLQPIDDGRPEPRRVAAYI